MLQGLSHNDAFRTNAGIFNTGDMRAVISVTAFDSAGKELGRLSSSIDAGRELAINGILVSLGIAPQSDIYLRVESDVPGAVYGWASSVDNASTDQTFIRPILLP